jgi:hypothetical protein
LLDDFEVEAIHPHAEVESSLQQGREEPGGRVPAVEQQKVVAAEFVEVFEKHLTLADVGRVELGGQGHFDPGQIEREAFGLDHVANERLPSRVLPNRVSCRSVASPATTRSPCQSGKPKCALDQDEEMIVEQLEGGGRHLLPGFGKGLRGDFSQQVGAVRQVGEERVQFRLHFGRVSAEQAGDQAGKTEPAGSGESLLRQTRLNEKSLRKKEVRERVNDVDIKISAYKKLPLYQGDRHSAGYLPEVQPICRPLMQLCLWCATLRALGQAGNASVVCHFQIVRCITNH